MSGGGINKRVCGSIDRWIAWFDTHRALCCRIPHVVYHCPEESINPPLAYNALMYYDCTCRVVHRVAAEGYSLLCVDVLAVVDTLPTGTKQVQS
jgi:hypothetical protein